MTLFRPQALTQQTDRLSGPIFIAVPLGWHLVGYLLFGSVAAAALFLSLASYARVEVATGTIQPNKGVVEIVPTRGGTIAGIYVSEGQRVEAGSPLAAVRSEEDAFGGLTAAERVRAAINSQTESLNAQIGAIVLSGRAQQQQLAAQRAGLMSEVSLLESQVALQGDLIRSAEKDLARAASVAERGFISGRDLQQRQEMVVTRKQQLSQLQQSLISKRADLAQATRSAAEAEAQANAQVASVMAARSVTNQQAATTEGGRAYVLRAPVAGTLTALTARVGQAAAPPTPLMAIIPAGSTLQALLEVPSSAIGFVKPGMEVRLAIDAFPHARFGVVTGTVLTVSATPTSRQGANGVTVASYPVTVALRQTSVLAYGKPEKLVPGMALTARIVSERQSLLQWLFDPFFAVGKR